MKKFIFITALMLVTAINFAQSTRTKGLLPGKQDLYLSASAYILHGDEAWVFGGSEYFLTKKLSLRFALGYAWANNIYGAKGDAIPVSFGIEKYFKRGKINSCFRTFIGLENTFNSQYILEKIEGGTFKIREWRNSPMIRFGTNATPDYNKRSYKAGFFISPFTYSSERIYFGLNHVGLGFFISVGTKVWDR